MADRSASEIGAGLNVLKDAAPGLGVLALRRPCWEFSGITSAPTIIVRKNGAGVEDAPSGQPVEGSHSNRLRVRVTPAPAQTQTMVVAPMHKNNDVEVAATAPDRGAAAEAAKLTGRGRSTVTVNYSGGARDSRSY